VRWRRGDYGGENGDGFSGIDKLWLTIINHQNKTMTQKHGQQKTLTRSKPFYSLAEVKQLVKEGRVAIRGNTRNTALVDFGWTANDIIVAIQKLKVIHFYKSEPSNLIENCMIDYYKAELNEESVYIHFYVRENRLVINSFKKL